MERRAEARKVTVVPRDEEAIERERAAWLFPRREAAANGTQRPRHMSIPEDNWDYEAVPPDGGY